MSRIIPPVDNLEDVRALIEMMGHGFHPDTPGAEYETEPGVKLFSPAEADQYDAALSQAFEICRAEGVDLYALAVEIYEGWAQAERYEYLYQEVPHTRDGPRFDGWKVGATGLTGEKVTEKLAEAKRFRNLVRIRPIAVPDIPADAGPCCAMGHPIVLMTKATYFIVVKGKEVVRATITADAGAPHPHPEQQFGVWSCDGNRCEAEISDEAVAQAVEIAMDTDWPQPEMEG